MTDREKTTRSNQIATVVFVVGLFAVPVWQAVSDHSEYRAGRRSQATPRVLTIVQLPWQAWRQTDDQSDVIERVGAWNSHLRQALSDHELDVTEDSPFHQFVRPRIQSALTSLFNECNSKVFVGEDGWLFYAPDLAHVGAKSKNVGVPPYQDAREAIADFRRQLEERGIELILLPTPVKPCVYPEQLNGGISSDRPLWAPGFDDLLRWMDDQQIAYVDPTETLVKMKSSAKGPSFLKTDTHWTPAAMMATAKQLALKVFDRVTFQQPGGTVYHSVKREVVNRGDLAKQLPGLPGGGDRFPAETVVTERVLNAAGQPWRDDGQPKVMLLGDSFANIYSDESMGWGVSAGLAERLSLALQRPVRTIVLNDGGATGTREVLSQRLNTDPGYLARVRVVIWQFAVRDLTSKEWTPIDLAASEGVTP